MFSSELREALANSALEELETKLEQRSGHRHAIVLIVVDLDVADADATNNVAALSNMTEGAHIVRVLEETTSMVKDRYDV